MIVSTLLLTLLLAPAQSDASPLTKSEAFPPDLQWKITEATARLGVRYGDGNSGSAVLIANRDQHLWALTCEHVVRESTQIDADFYKRASYPARNRVQGGVIVVAKNKAIDLALIKIPILAETDLPAVMPLLPPGQRPKRFPVAVLAAGCDDGFSPKCFDDRVQAKRLIRRSGNEVAFFWETAAAPREGRSGGGLFDEKGNVIGICSATQNGLGYYVHADEIHAWLKQQGQEWLWTGSVK